MDLLSHVQVYKAEVTTHQQAIIIISSGYE